VIHSFPSANLTLSSTALHRLEIADEIDDAMLEAREDSE